MASVIKGKFSIYDEDDVEVVVYLKEAEAKKTIKILTNDNGIYISEDTIDTMGGCSFSIGDVRFKLVIK